MSIGLTFEICLLTPLGRGAVATVAIYGRDGARALRTLFRASSSAADANLCLGRIYHGRWGAPGEEVVVCRRGAEEIDIHCHGGASAVEAIVEDLAAAGGTRVPWAECLARRTADAIASDALIALAAARTERTASILLDQWRGALAGELSAVQADLARRAAAAAIERLRELLRRSAHGLHLTTPFQVVLAGRPNVGKSSLINALVGYERAIVFDTPGTTRDVVTAETAVDGWPLVLSDTAGLRASNDPLEEVGVRRARERLASCDLVVLVFDASQPRSGYDDQLRREFPTALIVENKCDLVSQHSSAGIPAAIRTSALSGARIGDMLRSIGERLVSAPTASGVAVPFTTAQVRAIEQAIAALEQNDLTLASSVLASISSGSRDSPVGSF